MTDNDIVSVTLLEALVARYNGNRSIESIIQGFCLLLSSKATQTNGHTNEYCRVQTLYFLVSDTQVQYIAGMLINEFISIIAIVSESEY